MLIQQSEEARQKHTTATPPNSHDEMDNSVTSVSPRQHTRHRMRTRVQVSSKSFKYFVSPAWRAIRKIPLSNYRRHQDVGLIAFLHKQYCGDADIQITGKHAKTETWVVLKENSKKKLI
jgi:hypothetical protein